VTAVLAATYFTDPFCPWSWAAEGALRRLQTEFAGSVEVSFVMGGLAREVTPERARRLAVDTVAVMAESGMPADPRVWLEQPPSSSYPAGIAVHAVAEQADGAAYLRRLREAVLVERRRMDNAEALMDAARELGGLDLDRLRIDLGSHALLERFGVDLERSRGVQLPAIRFGDDGWVRSWRWEDWRAGALLAGAEPTAGLPGVEEALRRFGSMSTAEVAVVCDLPGPRAAAELWRLALDFRVMPLRVAGGELWRPAG
jgi:predicted DsbA family dithiol-disulfide isomerase